MVFENDKVRIGPPAITKKLKKGEIPAYLAELGLHAYEFSAGRMAKFSDSPDNAKFREAVEKYDLKVSIHAPYYISLTSATPETRESSVVRLANVYAWATWLKADRIVLHPGSYIADESPAAAIKGNVEGIKRGFTLADELFPSLKAEFRKICLCVETMGKKGQLGPTEEILQIVKEVGLDRCRPCIDFGHLYARNVGKLKDSALYEGEFAKIERELGSPVAQHLHIHYSHIEYTNAGEAEHVPNTDSTFGPDHKPLFKMIKERGYTPVIINESPELEPDAKLLMDDWNALCKK